jgi:hypothetical protein
MSWHCKINIVTLHRRRFDTAHALLHEIATDAAHESSAEKALHHTFLWAYKLAP